MSDADFQDIISKLYRHTHPHSANLLSEEMYILAIENAFNMIVITDCMGIVQYANSAVERITGFKREMAIGKKVGFWGGLMKKNYYKNLWNTILNGITFSDEIENDRSNGDHYLARIVITPIKKNKKLIGFIGTEEDITLEKKLQKDKEEFIALASHQLRNPLGVMKWSLELLESNNPKLRKDLSNISMQNQYMIDLVNRLLTILRIGDNRLVLKMERTTISAVLDACISHFQTRLHNKKIDLQVQDVYKDLTIQTDIVILGEIISNLLDNAIKYSKHNGQIIVEIKKTGLEWSLHVKDNGMGIAKKDLGSVCKKFYRGDNVLSIPGTGLGMYIVNTYVQKLNGTLTIKST
ncbi:MAG: PAS domain-containing sensor histidine kinase, partial [Candidatus Roizmanbacteria bacterium]|nr:PAS domain-containing sensor histidine kinase [Candidatus Roizmanbacteria bacterium]